MNNLRFSGDGAYWYYAGNKGCSEELFNLNLKALTDVEIINGNDFAAENLDEFINFPRNKCICGQTIKHMFFVKHLRIRQRTFLVGSECIKKFMPQVWDRYLIEYGGKMRCNIGKCKPNIYYSPHKHCSAGNCNTRIASPNATKCAKHI